ncbi:MAG: AAA family ATPase [SAR324 cluster bacterium]|nr:AAA family ATPase [SAR324 cluster bacterium]
MSELVDILSSYVPQFIRKRITEVPFFPAQTFAGDYETVVLFSDITGFTALAETLAQEGPSGMEKLTSSLNEYFAHLIERIHEHGGDVLKFAGDAILAVWIADEQESGLKQAARAAAQCGIVLQEGSAKASNSKNFDLSVRISIGVGTMWMSHLGGINEHWEILIAGEPLNQVASADKWGIPTRVTLSGEAWNLVRDFSEGTPVEEGNVRLDAIKDSAPLKPAISPILPIQAETALKHYIPLAIASRVSAGQTAWLAELRRITVLFINLPGQSVATDKNLIKNQQVMESFQTIIYRLEGSINKLSIDDKGVSLLVAWGLPPLTHEDDALRGIQAALAIEKALEKLGEKCAVGIATGTAFCGSVGSSARREYTMIGNVVNLSARLMQGALIEMQSSQKSAILCDEITRQGSVSHHIFETLPPLHLKGFSQAVSMYRPAGAKQSLTQTQTEMVGRRNERQLIDKHIQLLTESDKERLILLEGEPGIGKSRLVKHTLQMFEKSRVRSVLGEANSIESNTPYFAWRSIFRELLELNPGSLEMELDRKKILAALSPFPEYVLLAPLINPILALEFPENEESKKYADRSRLLKTQEILTSLLKQYAEKRPVAIVIEDAHWLDTASWSLLERVWTEVSPLFLMVSTRPFSGKSPQEYSRFRKAQNTLILDLEAMAPEETITLICQRLGVLALPQAAAIFIREKGQGNPFFSEEIAYALRDAGHLQIENNQCSLEIDDEELETLDFPHTVQGVITSRIDRLPPQLQFSLKVASVIGRVFSFPLLKDIYPIESDKIHLEEIVDTLERLDIIPREIPEAHISYIFKHIITHEVVYHLMLFSQRRILHRAVAEWYEQTYTSELQTHYPVLAHHWSLAVDKQSDEFKAKKKSIYYLEQSGSLALNSGAFPEAVQFLQNAWNLYADLPEKEKKFDQGIRLLQSLGTATFTTSGYGESSALEIFDKAWELCENRDEAFQIFPVLWGLWINYHFSSRTEESIELGEKLLSLAQKEESSELLLQAHHALWTTLLNVPDYKRAQFHLEEGWNLYRPEMHQEHCRLYGGHDPGACCQRAQCLSNWFVGFPDQAIQNGLKAIELSQAHHYSRLTAYLAIVIVFKHRGDIEKTNMYSEKIIELAGKQGFSGMIPWAQLLQGWCQGQMEWKKLGPSASFDHVISIILNASEKMGYQDPQYMAMLAEIYLIAGKIEEGLKLLDELFAVVEAKNEHYYEAELFRLKGEFLWARARSEKTRGASSISSENYEAIESCFSDSLEIAKTQGAKSFELRTAISLERLLRGRDQNRGKNNCLGEVFSFFSEGFETKDLKAAKALLES